MIFTLWICLENVIWLFIGYGATKGIKQRLPNIGLVNFQLLGPWNSVKCMMFGFPWFSQQPNGVSESLITWFLTLNLLNLLSFFEDLNSFFLVCSGYCVWLPTKSDSLIWVSSRGLLHCSCLHGKLHGFILLYFSYWLGWFFSLYCLCSIFSFWFLFIVVNCCHLLLVDCWH